MPTKPTSQPSGPPPRKSAFSEGFDAPEHVQQFAAARISLLTTRPYLATAILAVAPVYVEGLKTMACDKYWRVYMDPKTLTEWTQEEIRGVFMHELAHLLHEHADRCEALDADPVLFNFAGDIAINPQLIQEQFALPKGHLLPKTFGLPDGLLTEEYYERLREQAKKAIAAYLKATGKEKLDQDGEGGAGEAGPDPGKGICGSAATGVQQSWEEGAPQSAPGAEGSKTPGIGKIDAEHLRRMVAADVKQASKTQGDVPAGWQRWADAVLEPKIDWRRELAGAVRYTLADTAGQVDYSYARPARRQSAYGKVIVPALRQPVPKLCVVVDTSGSMSNDMLGMALAEIGGILKGQGAQRDLTVLSVDAAVHASRRVFAKEQVQLAGGGGTDMGEGLRAADAMRPPPDVVIVCTDMYTPWPDAHPRAPRIIIVDVSGDAQPKDGPGWAHRRITVPAGGKN